MTLPVLWKDGDPATWPAKQINKIVQLRTQNIKTVYTSRFTFYQISDI